MDLIKNTEGELDFYDLKFFTEDDYENEARQRLEQYLSLNKGEWCLDILAGIPYIKNPEVSLEENLRYFLGNKFPDTPRYIKTTLDRLISNLSFISKVEESSYTINPKTREYHYKATIFGIKGAPFEYTTDTFNI